MNYTVVWARKARDELAAVWLNATDRGPVANAANSLDRQLGRSPEDMGESRPSGRRIAYCLPLGIQFRILEEDRLVKVLVVWSC